MVVAFSCKGRGFCPSCTGRREARITAALADPAAREEAEEEREEELYAYDEAMRQYEALRRRYPDRALPPLPAVSQRLAPARGCARGEDEDEEWTVAGDRGVPLRSSHGMDLRPFGDTGLQLAPLALGAGPLGDHALDEARVERLVRGAVELGIGLVDTAPSYGCSEERLGRLLRGVRERIVLSTKLGYGVPGVADWTGECITGGIELALRRLATDRLDIAHLHSCGPEILGRDEVLRALEAAVQAGKVRLAAYSGDGEGLRAALRIPLFRVFQVSVSLVDQEALGLPFPAGVGVLGKRALANAAFLHAQEPERPDVREYWQRWQILRSHLPERLLHDLPALALRFAAHAGHTDDPPHAPLPHAILLGTTSLDNLAAAVAAIDRGPLAREDHRTLREAWARHAWPGMI